MRYEMREGPASATVDTEAALATQGSITAPGALLVPSGVSKIKQIVVGVGDGVNSGADGNANFLLRMSGAAVVDGEQTFTIGGAYQVFTTAGTTGFGTVGAQCFDVDIDVVGGSALGLYVQQAGGVTVGTPEFSVALGFQ